MVIYHQQCMKEYEAETEDSTESSMQLGVVYELNTCLNTVCDTSIQFIYKNKLHFKL